MRETKAIIDLAAIRHNLEIAKQLAPNTKMMAVVKADAYGHGIVQVARALASADAIAVACMDEALTLREAGISTDIILLEGFFSEQELRQAFEYQLQTVVHQESQLKALEDTSNDAKIKVWLKLDSGMNRLGFEPEDYQTAYERLSQLKTVEKIYLMSHLACADDIDNAKSAAQISEFKQYLQVIKGEASLANSAGVVAWPESHLQWIRPGILLYGCSPMLDFTGPQHQLKPAMTLESQLFAIKHLKPGETVGYGATWQAPQETRIGVIAIGYGDGYPHHAKSGTPVLINGKTYPLVGRVSMDMITVDLGLEDQFELGDKAILWGNGLPVEIIAKHANTIPWSLLCGVTSRVKFLWQD
ncbi:alanine racemase [Aliikangiella marina]|uniref:Alanine racemase n=1 Tax=Aliikangiella marina TaxID=1712262 RepID=A0A545TH11_9GAMM|nr:alanine racemase [Aliikangiella marina]TQV76520.1 alanine racemase [Aliikangiella marina]